MFRRMASAAPTLLAITLLLGVTQSQAQQLELKKQDRICILGNTLADRMQHDGWLESMIQARYPEHELYIRNLGFSGDQLTQRLRSANFGSPDDHLTQNRANVVFLMFGFNESFQGEEGLEQFKADLTKEIQHLSKQKYDGKSNPRIVVFSPIAFENLNSPNLPNGKQENERLALYSFAAEEVAQANKLPFVDLFSTTKLLYEAMEEPMTIDGAHLNSKGNQFVAQIICNDLFGMQRYSDEQLAEIEPVREKVTQKNHYWYNYYRATDGYSVFGGRAGLKFTDGQTNRDVMKREMEILELMTANRDLPIWAAAQGKNIEADDSNLPPFVPVITNKPGKGPDGKHVFLSGEEAIDKMRLEEGMEVTLFASEGMFPELTNPVQMSFDSKGRLWVATWRSYPHWKPDEPMSDKLLILEDTDNDGRADKCKVFADGLHNPTGFEFYGDGVFLAHQPDIMYLEDTDGDDVCDVRKRVVHGIGSADTHHAANSFVFGPGGALYFQEGTFHRTQSETPYGLTWMLNGGSYRFEPKTFKFEVYTSQNFANPHGHVFDKWGRDIVHDGTGAVPYDGAITSGKLPYPEKHGGPPTVYKQRTRPCPATEWLDSAHFPSSMQGDLLVLNVIGDLGILRYKITEDGSGLKGEELKPLLLSDDPNFRPVDIETAPDGTLYFVDWQNPIIGHMQHNLRDPSRDRDHGRIYQLKAKDRPLLTPVEIDGVSEEELIKVLANPDKRTRYRARLELYGRDTDQVVSAIKGWLPTLGDDSLSKLEALWMLQSHNVYDNELITNLLRNENPHIRAAATRVLCGLRDQATNIASLLFNQAADDNPRVRLEAVRTASFLNDSTTAIKVLAIASGQPTDKYLDYMIRESKRAISDDWKRSIASGLLDGLNAESTNYLLSQVSNAEVLTLPVSGIVANHLVFRSGIEDSIREGAIRKTAEQLGKSEVAVLVESLESADSRTKDRTVVNDLVRLLSTRTPAELKSVRERLVKMATSSKLPTVRRIGYIGMMLADQGSTDAWAQAVKSPGSIQDFVTAVPLVPDQSLQTKLYSRLETLVGDLPEGLVKDVEMSSPQAARFVRIELPGNNKILTLAEVQVFANGQNVARKGAATQSSTAFNGTADRAIDGNTDPVFSKGGQTHTVQTSNSPWWEVNLRNDFEVESVRVFNRSEGDLGKRLQDFTLKVLDKNREVLFESKKTAAPSPNSTFNVATISPKTKINRSAIDAISYIRGREAQTFKTLANLIVANQNRKEAIKSIQRVPARFWDTDRSEELLQVIVEDLNKLDVEQRTTTTALSAFQLSQTLTEKLPPEVASQYEAILGELGVQVISIGTRPHRMSYDKDVIVVPTDKQIQLIFENTDMMPHNLVITKPGTMEKVGLLAEKTSQQRGAFERHYVPNSSDVLFSGTLIQPQESETLTVKTPKKPGVYAYVCTYPGHWRRMYGKLIVVDSPKEYLANPDEYLAKHNIEILDEVLKSNRTKTEWKMADFNKAFPKEFHAGRDFKNGKQMFTLSSCISCHKMGDEGYAFGPEFKDLDPEWSAKDVLTHIIEPSKKIDDKYKTQTLLLDSGSTISGIVVYEDDDIIKLVENPIEATKEIKVEKFEIEGRKRSEVSIMPLGLVDTLTREEVLDLLAYVMANGDEKHRLFKNGEHDH